MVKLASSCANTIHVLGHVTTSSAYFSLQALFFFPLQRKGSPVAFWQSCSWCCKEAELGDFSTCGVDFFLKDVATLFRLHYIWLISNHHGVCETQCAFTPSLTCIFLCPDKISTPRSHVNTMCKWGPPFISASCFCFVYFCNHGWNKRCLSLQFVPQYCSSHH